MQAGNLLGAAIGAGAQSAQQQQLILSGLVSRINSLLLQVSDRQEIIGQALGRLTNPRPTPAGADQNKIEKNPTTLEDELQQISRFIERIRDRAIDQADTLNSAI